MGFSVFFNVMLIIFSVFMIIHAKAQTCSFQSLYQFGDSISDTGNLIRVLPVGPTLPINRLPYGSTFPGTPTGRSSDGRLIVDYIATSFGLPLPNAYLNTNANFNNSVNFAVAGSLALELSFFAEMGVPVPNNIPNLGSQVQWFITYLNSTCNSTRPTECYDRLRSALFIVGETGRNDITYALLQGLSLQQIQNYVFYINQSILMAARRLIRAGAVRLVVPGNFPFGCFPFILNLLRTNNSTAFDDYACLTSANRFAISLNDDLQQQLNMLKSQFPNVTILYADYYNAFQSVLRSPTSGFDPANLLKACCGIEGQYNPFNPGYCGNPGAPVCSNPNQYIHWDGLNLTQEAYRRISQIIIRSILVGIGCLKL